MNNKLRYICIKINEFCNLNCIHCRAGSNPFLRQEIDFKKVLSFIDELILNGLDHVNITGGEPTLYSKFYDFINELIQRDIYITITTNGLTDFTNKVRQSIFTDTSKLRVRFSIDGSKILHEKIRGKNTYRRTIANLKLLNDLQIWKAINTVVYNDTVEDLINLYEDTKKIELDEWAIISPVQSRNSTIFNSNDLLNPSDVIKTLNLAKEKLKSIGFKGDVHLIDFYSNPNTYLFVNEKGNILLPGLIEKEDIIISNLDDYSLDELYEVIDHSILSNNKTYFNW